MSTSIIKLFVNNSLDQINKLFTIYRVSHLVGPNIIVVISCGNYILGNSLEWTYTGIFLEICFVTVLLSCVNSS